jgi:hypothetical protein
MSEDRDDSDGRDGRGRFAAGNRANPRGRPRRTGALGEDIARELKAGITITENGRRKRVSKLSASAKQIANQGASGDLRAARLAVDLALKADREREAAPAAAALAESDRAIVMRFIARLRATELFEENDNDDA